MSSITYSLYTDGGARGNPGPAAIGGLLMRGGSVIAEFAQYIGSTTNNQAEYTALITGLELALKQGAKRLKCFIDSELVVMQLTGQYKIKDSKLTPLARRATTLQSYFENISLNHIPRAMNRRADALVNLTLDKRKC